MFETQSTDEWLPEWAWQYKPFLISVLVTPVALLVGLADWGPEGPQVYVGFLIFPYAALVYLAGAFTQNISLLYLSLLLVFVQFPVYGVIMSSFPDRSRAGRVLLVLHLVLGLPAFGFILSLLFFRHTLS